MYQRSAIVKQCQPLACMILLILGLMGLLHVYATPAWTVPSLTSVSNSAARNSSITEWMESLKNEVYALECTYVRMAKAIALLNATNCSSDVISKRSAQLEKVRRAISSLHEEMFYINSTCAFYSGPDCTDPICDSKCLTCVSPGNCSECSGHFYGPSCSLCTGNWDGLNCSTCKYGWSGSNCLTPIVDLGELVNSTILNRTQSIRFVYEMMKPYQNKTIKIIYRATKDGFQGYKFHSVCDLKGANFVLIKIDTGAIFGGYTSVGWGLNTTNGYYADEKAFIYSLISSNQEERFQKMIQDGQFGPSKVYAIYLGPAFGLGGDINIGDSSNTVYSSSTVSIAPGTYTNMGNKTYLTGASAYNHFLVNEIEVYTL